MEFGRRTAVLGAIFFAVCAGVVALRFSSREAVRPVIGAEAFLDVSRVRAAHPGQDEILKLRAEIAGLSENFSKMESEEEDFSAKVPVIDPKPFEDVARQKKRQAIIKAHGEFMERMADAEKAFRDSIAAEFEAARKEIDDIYFNEIFNIQLKFDNADVMKLDDATRANLKARLAELKHERGRRQIKLREEHEARIKEYMDGLRAAHRNEISALESQSAAELQAEELLIKSEAEARNFDAMQKALANRTEKRQRIWRGLSAIEEKERELAVSEDRILRDISAKAAKIARSRHYSVVYADHAKSGRSFSPEEYSRVIAGSADDITDEVIAAVKIKNNS